MLPNVRRFSDARLQKELAFAVGFDIPGEEASGWLRALQLENERRIALRGRVAA